MKKVYRILLASMLALALLAGCTNNAVSSSAASASADASSPAASTGGSGERTQLVMLSSGLPYWEEPMNAVKAAFEEKYPDIELVVEYYGYEQLLQLVEVKLGSGSTDYDVIAVDAPVVAAYTERGYILPLDDVIPASDQAKFTESSLIASKWNGGFMASPMATSSQLLFYNKDLLDQAGIAYPEADVNKRVTWESLVESSDKILDAVDPDRNQGFIGIALEQVSRAYQCLPLPNSLGEKSIGEDGYTVDGIINTDGWVKAMTFYHDMFANGESLRGIAADQFGSQFQSGKAAFFLGGTWNSWMAAPDSGMNVGYAPFPCFEGYEDQVATPTGSWHLGISAFSTHTDEAAKFIRFITLEEGSDIWLEGNGDVSARQEVLDRIENDPDADPVLKIASYEAAHTAYPRPVTPGYTEYETVLNAAFEDIRNGADPKTALDDAVAQIDQLFQKYK